MRVELARELDGVVESELGARADGEMRGMRSVAHQHDVRPPLKWLQAPQISRLKIEPCGAPQMARVGHQFRAVQRFGEQLLAKVDRALLVELVQAVRRERLVGRLDDEGRGVAVEFVDMRLEPAMLGAAEVEGESVEQLSRAEPDVAIGPYDQIGLEDVGIAFTDLGIDPVCCDDQIGIRKLEVGIDLAIECEFDAELFAAALQDVQQLLASDADEAVAGRALLACL